MSINTLHKGDDDDDDDNDNDNNNINNNSFYYVLPIWTNMKFHIDTGGVLIDNESFYNSHPFHFLQHINSSTFSTRFPVVYVTTCGM